MARTHKVQRGYIDRIIEVRRQILPALETEVHAIAGKLGIGTFRSQDYPGLMVAVAEPRSNGGSTDWKGVAMELARKHNIPVSEVMSTARYYTRPTSVRSRAYAGLRTTVKMDKAKAPKVVY